MNGLKGKIAVITGAAGGIGSQVAESFLERGASVVIFDLREMPAQKERKELIFFKGDVTSDSDVEKCYQIAREKFGIPHILVTCAGITGPTALAQDIDTNEWEQVIRINLTGTFQCVKKIIPLMLENRWGRIICFASGAGVTNPLCLSPYNVSKAGVISLVRTIVKEIDVENICINAICPGTTDTPMIQNIEKRKGTGKVEELIAWHRDLRDAGLHHQPRDAIDLITFLASEESRYISGQFIQLIGTRLSPTS